MYQKLLGNTITKVLTAMVFTLGLVFLLSNAPATLAQGTNGRLVVTVKDQTEAVVAGATIKVVNQGTSQEITGTTNDSGVSIFPQMAVGLYTVKVEVPGFKTAAREDLKIDVGQEYGIVIALEVGSEGDVVTVTAGEELVQTTTSEVRNTVSEKQVQELPINGRDPLQLIQLQAGVNSGVNNARAQATTTINGQRASTANLTQDGINIQDNLLRRNSLDFSPNRPSVAQIAEFTVTTQNGGAEVSGGASAIRAVSPNGTNEYHGSLFEYHRNSALGANDFFNNLQEVAKPQLIRNQFGGTISGPIFKEKLFFFGFYEGLRERIGTPFTGTVLLPNARQGVFTYRDNSGQTRTINVLGLRNLNIDPAIANILNASPQSANATTVGDGLNTSGFALNRSFNQDRNVGGFRLDYVLNSNHRFEGVFNRATELVDRPDADVSFAAKPGANNNLLTYFAVGAWNWQITPNLTNELRIGGNRPEGNFGSNADLNSVFLTLPLITNPNNQFTPEGRTTSTISYIDSMSYTRGDHFFRFGGQFNRIRTNPFVFNAGTPPQFTIGFGVGAPDEIPLTSRDFPGGIDPTQLNTANNLLALLSGALADGQVNYEVTSQNSGYVSGIPNRRNYEYKEYSGYFTDSWRTHPRLTVNLGLRWDYRTPLKERDNLLLAPVLNGRNVREAVLDPNGSYGFVDGFIANPDRANFAPNISFAWDIPGLGRQTVLRGGYSISYVNDQAIAAPRNALEGNDGLSTVVNRNDIFGYLSRDVQNLLQSSFGAPQFVVPRTYLQNFDLDNTAAAFAVNPDIKTPYFHQWNVSIDREISNNMVLSLRYVGNKSTNLIRGIDLNQVDVVNNGFAADVLRAQSNGFLALAQTGRFDPRFNPNIAGSQQLLVFPNIAGGGLLTNTGTIQPLIQRGEAGTLAQVYHQFGLAGNVNFVPNSNIFVADVLDNGAESNYHALQVEMRRRFSNGLTFQANYTWSKNLTSSPGTNAQILFEPLLDNNQPGLEYARSILDIPHTLKANVIYELPFGPGKRFNPNNAILRKVVGGWQVTSIITVQSGSPFSIVSGRGTLNRGGRSLTTNTANTSLTNEQIKDLIGFFPTENGIYLINPAILGTDGRAVSPDGRGPFAGQVFFNPGAGQVGSMARQAFNNPRFSNWDFSVIKRTPITEKIDTEFRAEFFNFTNSPMFGIEDPNINSAVFGQARFQLNSPRIIQLAFKIVF